MKSLIIQVLLLSVCVTSLFSNQNNMMKSNPNDTCQDVYQGIAFNVKIFIMLKNDKAIAEWFYDEVSPTIFYIDTLNYQNYIWSGEKSKIIKNKDRLYFEAIEPYSMKVKLKKTDMVQWKSEYYRNKNAIILSTEYLSFKKDTTFQIEVSERVRIWQEMSVKYELYEKSSQLNPNEFLNEFKNFKRELILKLKELY